jgi:hypothetical protein
VDEFFERLRKPVLADKETPVDLVMAGSIGKLCMIYGGFITLLAAAPNSLEKRACFLACGGLMLGSGFFLARRYRT